jgi:hypothetical protein
MSLITLQEQAMAIPQRLDPTKVHQETEASLLTVSMRPIHLETLSIAHATS